MRRILQVTSIALLTIFFLGLFLWKSNLREVWRIMTLTNLFWLGSAFLVNWLALIFRTVRWRTLLAAPKPPDFYPTFFANTTGYMLSTVLPIRAGDVARPALLARRTNVRFAEALGTVLTERVLDLFSILGLFIWFCVMRWNSFPNEAAVVHGGALGCAAVMVALTLFLVGLYFFGDSVRRLHERIGHILPKRFREPWMKFFDAFAKTLEITERPRDFFTVVFATIGVWVCLTAQYSLVFIATHRPLPYDATFFISGVTTIGVAIPTPGGVGGFHKLCQWALTSFYGFDINSSVAIALLLHLVGTVPVVLTGVTLFAREGLRWRDLTRAAKDVPGDTTSQS
ncbi:MAG TPA: lysylphosphatidylglycerol synthase transmembrane domain-containing protein [Thermoanaerobaculia bacterium]|nr:lysylphosphatidylglycerol synthase transmembrane domain-containing protein [Thermoanaerobaculia bacterium]